MGEYVLVIEDKADRDKLCLRDSDGAISQTVEATRDYAVNGAVWYARKILGHGAYTKIFALGCAGDSRHHALKPVFVDSGGVKELDEIETFKNFSEGEIEKYYKQKVLEEESPEELQLEELISKSRELHEHLRNYGNLGDTEKPLVVSAILLALSEQKYGFRLGQLTGDDTDTDGAKLYRQLENSIKRARVSPDVKREKILNQFRIIGASSLNKGITHFISNTNETKEADCISVNRNGSVGYAFYHPYEALYSIEAQKLSSIANHFTQKRRA